MILHKKPRRYVIYKGKKIKLRPEFYRVLRCGAILSDSVLDDMDKLDLCLTILIRHKFLIPHNAAVKAELFQVIFSFLADENKRSSQPEKVFDFEQDAAYIYAAFWQCYRIDLYSRSGRKLHWHQFISLFSSLPEDVRMMQIISIRARPMPKATKYNTEERQSLAKLKMTYRLYIPEEERKKQFEIGLAKMAIALQSMAKNP